MSNTDRCQLPKTDTFSYEVRLVVMLYHHTASSHTDGVRRNRDGRYRSPLEVEDQLTADHCANVALDCVQGGLSSLVHIEIIYTLARSASFKILDGEDARI